MIIVVDMNLSPVWVERFRRESWDAVHWSTVGSPTALDREIFDWAAAHGRIVLTHDLDFGAILASTASLGPSVIQVRALDVLPDTIGDRLVTLLRAYSKPLSEGALLVVDSATERIRMLPLTPKK